MDCVLNEPKIGIVIVNYNAEKYQNDSIRSIKKMDYSNYEIVVVDNNSTDNSIKLLRNEFPEVIIIETGDNLGVAAGNNVGIKHAIKLGAEYVLLLNNDIELDSQLLKILVANASKKIMTVPKIYYFNNKRLIWSAGGAVNWDEGVPMHLGYKCRDANQYNYERVVEIAPTCCMLIHRDVFRHVGLMDEKFFMYYDDTDFCIRANMKGYKILYLPSAVMWHKVSSSSGGEKSKVCQYYTSRNLLYFMKKYNKKVGKKWSRRVASNLIESIKNYYLDPNAKYSILGAFDFIRGKMYRKDFR
jgi:GT2 family glycosyltransferase